VIPLANISEVAVTLPPRETRGRRPARKERAKAKAPNLPLRKKRGLPRDGRALPKNT